MCQSEGTSLQTGGTALTDLCETGEERRGGRRGEEKGGKRRRGDKGGEGREGEQRGEREVCHSLMVCTLFTRHCVVNAR